MKEPNSEQIANCWRWVDKLKVKVNDTKVYPLAMIVFEALALVESFYGSKADLAKELIDKHRWEKGYLTPEEIAEMEEIDRDIEKAKADEIEALRADFTPVDFESDYWADFKDLAIGLLDSAQEGEKEFDEFFNKILAHRYGQKVVVAENGQELEVYQKKSEKDVLLAQVLGD